jgi:transposase InsO family protein
MTGALRRVVEITPAPAASDAQMTLALTAPVGPNLSLEDRAEAERRYRVIEPLIERAKFSLLYAQYPRLAQVYDYVAAAEHVKVRTLYRWVKAWQVGGYPGLVRRDRADKGEARAMNEPARELLLRLAAPGIGDGVLRVAEMWRVYEEERAWRGAHMDRAVGPAEREQYRRYVDETGRLTAAAQLPEISARTFRDWYERIPEMFRTLAREGVDAYRNQHEIISHRDIAAVAPMEYVVMDHRVLDVFCMVRERGGWRLARPWLTAAIDMRTRKWLAWAIVETPSSDSIACVLKRLFCDFGLPGSLYWDNGKDFTCQWFEGLTRRERKVGRIGDLDPTWRGVLGTLDIRVHHAIAYNARAKIIEPNFNRIANVDRAQPEWCGHNPGARPERFEELVRRHEKWVAGEYAEPTFRTIEEIASLYSRAIRDINERPLEGQGMRTVTPDGYGWMCPNQAWETLIGGVARRDVPPEVLHMCFAKRKALTVQHSEISTTHDGRVYHYRMSDNSRRLMALDGRVVDLAFDPLDLEEAAVYYQSRFFGLVRCVELRRMGEQAFVEDEKDRRATRREMKKLVRGMHAMAPAPTFEQRLDRRAEVVPAREDARVSIPVAIAGPVMEAVEAARCAAEAAEPVVVEKVVAAEHATEDDGEFRFFG